MKYILMMTGKKSDFEAYASWSKDDLQAMKDQLTAMQEKINTLSKG